MKDLTSLPLPDFFKQHYSNRFTKLTPIQEKAVSAGLLENKSLLISAPTASGKTLVATMAISNTLGKGKSLYLVPLKALASEKYKEYQNLFKNTSYKVAMATGDVDDDAPYLAKYDLLILTTEKLDALLRHQVTWIREVKTVVVDEIHLLNDPKRGPTLEIVLTLLKALIKPQLIGLSATIGNPETLAAWLETDLVQDTWRPVELKKGILIGDKVKFYDSRK
ncbi:DEAD/DEAH box helicase [Candidatus Woesearchaeota archaeon]|nr:DEAD/DEAH box helicase [Candidatus Woesearchaeota archaeon]